jgi:DNA-binding phage protein
MLALDEVRARLVRLSDPENPKSMTTMDIARETGLHFNSIYQIRVGKNHNPTLKTLEILSEFLKNRK